MYSIDIEHNAALFHISAFLTAVDELEKLYLCLKTENHQTLYVSYNVI